MDAAEVVEGGVAAATWKTRMTLTTAVAVAAAAVAGAVAGGKTTRRTCTPCTAGTPSTLPAAVAGAVPGAVALMAGEKGPALPDWSWGWPTLDSLARLHPDTIMSHYHRQIGPQFEIRGFSA